MRSASIASAPFEVRERLNTMLLENATADEIKTYLDGAGVADVNDAQLENWREGCHKDWLANQKEIDAMSLRNETSLALIRELKKAGDNHITEANQLLLAGRLNEVLRAFDTKALTDLLKEKPKEFFSLASALIAQSSERIRREKLDLEFQKYRDRVAEQKRKIEDAVKEGKNRGGFSTETIEKIERELKLL